MIYTSYFAKAKYIENDKKLVSIARFSPKGLTIASAPELMPTKEILLKYKQDGNEEEYIEAYHRDVLSKLSPSKIAIKYRNKVLLCYERPEAFCHRHLIAQWLKDHGFKCEELHMN